MAAVADQYKPRLVETVTDHRRERSTPPPSKNLDRDMATFRECIQSIGTQFDNGKNRREIRRLRSVIKKRIEESEQKLKETHGRSVGAEKVRLEQQSKQLDSQLGTFQDLLQEEVRATKQHPNAPVDATSPSASEGVDFVDYAGDYLRQTQQVSRLEQRELEAEELVELERDINDLHMIHRDLAELVGEQGETVERIDQQVARTQIRVERGQRQLKEAKKLKKKNRCFLCRYLFCCCCCS